MSSVDAGAAIKLATVLAELGAAAWAEHKGSAATVEDAEEIRQHASELQGRIKPWSEPEDDGA